MAQSKKDTAPAIKHCKGTITDVHVGSKNAFGGWKLIYQEDGETMLVSISETVAHVLMDNGMHSEG